MDASTRFLILSLDGGSYAIPLTRLLEITEPRGIQKDANLTSVFEGKYEYRGKRIPVLNLKKIFKLPGKPGSALLIFNSARGILAILVDSVVEIIELDQKPALMPKGVMNSALRAFTGVLRHRQGLILLLNEDGLLQ